MPRALKEWQAFEDLRKRIDDFNEMVPLLELMANKAMKPRHWMRMQETTGHVFDIESENFTLRNILSAPLLKYKEEIEVCKVLPWNSLISLTYESTVFSQNTHKYKNWDILYLYFNTL